MSNPISSDQRSRSQYTRREHYENIDAVSMEWKPAWPEPQHSRKARLPDPGMNVTGLSKPLLYRIIDRHYPEFLACIAEQGKPLHLHIKKEFDEFLKCGRLDHGFLRVQCSTCHKERLVAFSCKRRGFCPSCGARRQHKPVQ